MGIPFRWGRVDAEECTTAADLCDVVTAEHRLPSSSLSLDHIKQVFVDRMGFNAKQVVALMGAHSIGKLEKANSGYTGVWETSLTPSVLDCTYYRGIITVPWNRRTIDLTGSSYGGTEAEKYEWVQPAFTAVSQKGAILLNTDMCLAWKIGDKDNEVNAGRTEAAKCVSRCVKSDYFVSKKGTESCTGATVLEGAEVNGGSLGPTSGKVTTCYRQDDPWRMWTEKFAMDEQTWYNAFAPAFQKMIELGYSTSGGIKGKLYEVGEEASALVQANDDMWEE